MTIKDYIDKIVSIGYEWAEHELSGNKGIAIRKDDNKIFVSYKGIERQGWDTLKRGIPNLTHMTRIVGYYSQVNNWNPSKLGELKDRQAGDYVIQNG